MKYRSGICNFCGTGCGNIQRQGEGGISGILPRDRHPVSRGRLCLRGWHLHELLGTPERIISASVRKDGLSVSCDYREAVASAADILSECGAPSSGFMASPQSSNEDIYAMVKLARCALRCANIGVASDAGHSALLSVFRAGCGLPAWDCSIKDLQDAGAIVVLGSDLALRNPIIASEVLMAHNRGAFVLGISAKPASPAGKSSKYFKHIPGTLTFLLNAIGTAMLQSGMAPVEKLHSLNGFASYQKKILSKSPEWYAETTGIKWEGIREAAESICAAGKIIVIVPTGISGHTEEAAAAAHNLLILSGAAFKKDSGILPAAAIANICGAYDAGASNEYLPGYRSPGDSEGFKAVWPAEFNSERGEAVAAMLDGNSPLKVLVISDYNEEILRYIRGRTGKLKIIFTGSYTNELAEIADVVIPSLNFMERDGTYTSTERRVQINRGWSPPPGRNIHPQWKIWSDIAAELNAGWAFNSFDEIFAELCAAVPQYAGIKPGDLDRGQGIQWAPAGSPVFSFINIGTESAVMADSAGAGFRLVAGNAGFFWHKNEVMKKTYIPKREYNATLRLYPRGLVEISAEDAGKLGVRGRDLVRIKSDSGEMSAEVKISGGMRNGTVNIPYFVGDAIPQFLLRHRDNLQRGEDFPVKVSIEKV